MNPEQNKKNAIAFYKTAFGGNPRKAVEDYVGENSIQQIPRNSANRNKMY